MSPPRSETLNLKTLLELDTVKVIRTVLRGGRELYTGALPLPDCFVFGLDSAAYSLSSPSVNIMKLSVSRLVPLYESSRSPLRQIA